MINNMDLEHIIGMMGKYSIRLLKIYIKDIGLMDKEMDLELSFLVMVVNIKDILVIAVNRAMELLWIKMEILNYNIFKRINSYFRFHNHQELQIY